MASSHRRVGTRWQHLAFVLIACLCVVAGVHAQGCSQCRDTVSQTNPGVQSSYRTAIVIMIAAAATLSTVAIVTLRRMQ